MEQNDINTLKELIISCHNPKLVIPDESPNANTIYHVYSDGEITEQKGGIAYLQRSERTIIYDKFQNKNPEIFPLQRENMYNKMYGYAIVTYSDALRIIDMMSQVYNSKKLAL